MVFLLFTLVGADLVLVILVEAVLLLCVAPPLTKNYNCSIVSVHQTQKGVPTASTQKQLLLGSIPNPLQKWGSVYFKLIKITNVISPT